MWFGLDNSHLTASLTWVPHAPPCLAISTCGGEHCPYLTVHTILTISFYTCCEMAFQSIPELSVDAKKLLGQEYKEILLDKCPWTQEGQKLHIPSLTLFMLEGWKLATEWVKYWHTLTRGGRGVSKKLTFADEGGGGGSKKANISLTPYVNGPWSI